MKEGFLVPELDQFFADGNCPFSYSDPDLPDRGTG